MRIKQKFTSILFVVLVGFLMVSCSEDDDMIQIDNEQLIGEWQGETVNYSGTSTYEVQGVKLVSEFDGVGYDVDYSITFNEGLDQVSSLGSYSIELTTSSQGQSFTIDQEGLDFSASGSIFLEGNEIEFHDGSIGTIVDLSESYLEINLYKKETVSVSGFETVTVIDMVITFTR